MGGIPFNELHRDYRGNNGVYWDDGKKRKWINRAK